MNIETDFSLTADQIMIRDSAAHFLKQASSSFAVRRSMASEDGIDKEMWRHISTELGWCATHISEQHGGLSLEPMELVLLMEQMGRRLACVPFFSTVCIAAGVLAEIAPSETANSYLAKISAGNLTASLPLGIGMSDWLRCEDGAVAAASGDDYILDGSFLYVPDGISAQLLLIPARMTESGILGLFAVPNMAKGVTSNPKTTLDSTRRIAEVRLSQVRLPADALLGAGDLMMEGLVRGETKSMIFLAAEQLGGAQQCLDMTVEYVEQRMQFGRSVSSFQAVKHRCAEMMIKVEAARSAVYGAAHAIKSAASLSQEELELEAACAKVFASDAFSFCSQEAIQLHGGVGFTWEYDPHLYFKRAQASSHWLGHPDQLREQVAASLLD